MGIGKPLESLPNVVWEFKGELRRKGNRLNVSKEDRQIKGEKKKKELGLKTDVEHINLYSLRS